MKLNIKTDVHILISIGTLNFLLIVKAGSISIVFNLKAVFLLN
jgi:hypothetical protein